MSGSVLLDDGVPAFLVLLVLLAISLVAVILWVPEIAPLTPDLGILHPD